VAVSALDRMMRRLMALTAHFDPPFMARVATDPACPVVAAHPRPTRAPSFRDGAPPLPTCVADQEMPCRPVVRPMFGPIFFAYGRWGVAAARARAGLVRAGRNVVVARRRAAAAHACAG
jgi:hypothetical protein